MSKHTISKFLFTFTCVLTMVYAFATHSNIDVARAAASMSNEVKSVSCGGGDVTWKSFIYKEYTYEIDAACKSWITSTSCTSAGLKLYVRQNTSADYFASRTGYVYAKKNGVRKYKLTIKQSGHAPSGVVMDKTRTCETDGVGHHVCGVCNYVGPSNVKMPKTGHSFTAWKIARKPNCTETGIESRTCTRCQKVETRTYSSCCGHVYERIRLTDPATNPMNSILFGCDRCGRTTTSIDAGSDVILAYQRFNSNKSSLYDYGKSLFDYKKNSAKYQGNDGKNTYLCVFSKSQEFKYIWNNCIPDNARHIYIYGHGAGSGTLEFHDETKIDIGKMAKDGILSRKTRLRGDVYVLSCDAGDLSGNTEGDVIKTSDNQTSTLRIFAYLCPDQNVIGVQGSGISFDGGSWTGDFIPVACLYDGLDGKEGNILLPVPSKGIISTVGGLLSGELKSGYFVYEYYDSNAQKCLPTGKLGKDIRATNFLESYL